MDPKSFDRFSKLLSTPVTRDAAGRLGVAALLGGIVSQLPAALSAKKKKRKKGGKPRTNKGPAKNTAGGPTVNTVPSGPSVTPTEHEGNFANCPDDVIGFKVDPPKSGFRALDLDCGKCKVIYTVSDDKKYLSFTIEGGCKVYTVVVKGGNKYYKYSYPEGTTGDSGLRSPNNNGGNVPDISHFNFCDIRCDCVAKDCEALGYECGDHKDNCGNDIKCGGCKDPYSTCNADGICEEECKPKDCEALGYECGDHKDNCGNDIKCGGCKDPYSTCNADGICEEECKPKDCEALGYECGDHKDNCGNDIKCGGCKDPYSSTCNADGICEAKCNEFCDPYAERGDPDSCCPGFECEVVGRDWTCVAQGD